MSDPGDGTRLLLTVLFALWLGAFGFAFLAHGLTFAADAESQSAFLGWQGIAGLFAVAVFGVSRQWPASTTIRRLGLVPLMCAGMIWLGIILISMWKTV